MPVDAVMAQLDPESIALKRQVEEAFANVPFPGERGSDLCDTGDPCEEDRQIRMLAGKRWEDWKDKPLEALSEALHNPELFFLTRKAFHYYLPLYMLAAAFCRGTDMIPESLVFVLTRPDDPKFVHLYEERMEAFGPKQVKAILAFLQYMRRYYQQPHLDMYLDALNKAIASTESLLSIERFSVHFIKGLSPERRAFLIQKAGGAVIRDLSLFDGATATVPADSVSVFLASLRKQPEVRLVENF